MYGDIDVNPAAGVDETEARARIAALAGIEPPATLRPELMMLPLDAKAGQRGTVPARLADAPHDRLDIVQYFIDAPSGDVVLQDSDRQTQSAVGRARGVLGDSKKISVVGERQPISRRRPACDRQPSSPTT